MVTLIVNFFSKSSIQYLTYLKIMLKHMQQLTMIFNYALRGN